MGQIDLIRVSVVPGCTLHEHTQLRMMRARGVVHDVRCGGNPSQLCLKFRMSIDNIMTIDSRQPVARTHVRQVEMCHEHLLVPRCTV